MVGSVIFGAVTAPLAHVACVTRGSTGVTSMHDTSSNVSRRVAVAGVCSVHPPRSSSQANPGLNVAVTVTA